MTFRTMEWREDESVLRLIDQKCLPEMTRYIDLGNEGEIAACITDLTVRGAPAIGVAAAFGMVSAANRWPGWSDGTLEDFHRYIKQADTVLRASRPTAVNLFWALDRMSRVIASVETLADMRQTLLSEARVIEAEDIEVNRAISRHAMTVVPQEATFFHHCNTGTLATVELGTALGIIRTAHESGRKVMAYIDETRPRLQGSKLSSWELQQYGVEHAVVVDGASAHIMRTQHVDLCVVGCDRVAANGDTANKIGTYNLALAAKDNNVPFYVAAPSSTVDFATPDGDSIEIEARDPSEVTEINGIVITPKGTNAFNPAFDVTPARLITGIITEFGIAEHPFTESLSKLIRANRQD